MHNMLEFALGDDIRKTPSKLFHCNSFFILIITPYMRGLMID